jgi:hypothetical protein
MKSLLTSIFLIIPFITVLSQSIEVPKSAYLFSDWRPGFVSITELTGAPGIGLIDEPYAKYYYGITTIAGYQFTRNIKAGVGIGVHRHNEGTLFPLFLDGRYSFNAQKYVPFIAAAGGMAFNFNDIGQSYLFINPSVGIRYVVASGLGLSFSSGLMIMSAPGGRDSFINFKLGLELKGK